MSFPATDIACPPDEVERQRAVDSSGIVHRGFDARLQRIVEAAARVARTPIAALSIIDRSRQWIAAQYGVIPREMPRSISLCAHAIHRPGEAMIVPDATLDLRFARNPLVHSAPFIRFYAGIPLVDRSGYALGALCVIDDRPHDEPPNLFELHALAREAERAIA